MNIKFKIPEGFISANDYQKYTTFEVFEGKFSGEIQF